MKKIHLLAIAILMFNCHNAQKKMGTQQIPLEKQITYMIDLTLKPPTSFISMIYWQ